MRDRDRIAGLVHIAEGIALVLVGERAPSWSFRFAWWRRGRRR